MIPPHSERATPPGLGFVGFAVLFFFWSFAPGLLAQTPGGEPEEVYEKSLVHPFPASFAGFLPMDEEEGELLMVPVARLEANLTQQATDAPLPSDILTELIAYSNQVAAHLDRRRCNISPADYNRTVEDPKNPLSTHLLEFLQAEKIVLQGTIEHITVAWNFHYKTPTAIVFVRIEEVMRDVSESFAVGQLVTYTRQWGEATILGIPHCTNPPHGVEADRAPGQEGDQIILTGTKDLRNPDHLIAHYTRIYPVVEGIVSPPVGASGFSESTATLDEVRERLR